MSPDEKIPTDHVHEESRTEPATVTVEHDFRCTITVPEDFVTIEPCSVYFTPFSLQEDSCFSFCAGAGKMVVIHQKTGAVDLPDGVGPDEASRAFYEVVRTMFTVNIAEELRDLKIKFDTLVDERDKFGIECRDRGDALIKTRRRVEELEAALRPFAEYGAVTDPGDWASDDGEIGETYVCGIRWSLMTGWFRRAVRLFPDLKLGEKPRKSPDQDSQEF